MTTAPTLAPSQPHPLQVQLCSSRLLYYVFTNHAVLATQHEEYSRQFCEYLTHPSHRWLVSLRPTTGPIDAYAVKEECTLLTLLWPAKAPDTTTLFFGPAAAADNLSATVLPASNLDRGSPIFVLKNKQGQLYSIKLDSSHNLEIADLQLDCVPPYLYKTLPDGTHLLTSWSSIESVLVRAPAYAVDDWIAKVSWRGTPSKVSKGETPGAILGVIYEHPDHGEYEPLRIYVPNCFSATNEQLHQALNDMRQAFTAYLRVCNSLCTLTSSYSLINQMIEYNTTNQQGRPAEISCSSPINPAVQLRLTLRLVQRRSDCPPDRLDLRIQVFGVDAASLKLPSTNLRPLEVDLNTPLELNPEVQTLFTHVLPFFHNYALNSLTC